MFTVADAPAVGLPTPDTVDVPKTSVVALNVTAGPVSHQLLSGLMATRELDLEHRWGIYRGLLVHTSGANISKARNELLRRFLAETDAEWAWLIDSDMAIKSDTLPRLLCAAEISGAKAIGALCCMIADDGPIPTIFQLGDQANGEVTRVMLDYPDNTVVQVAATGAACLLVHRSVLEAMQAENPHLNYPWVWEEEINGQWVSEDVLFTLRINAAGFPVFVDCTHEVGHVKGSTVWWPSDIRKMRGFPTAKNYAVIPSKTPGLAAATLLQLEGQGLDGVVVLDNTEHGTLADIADNVTVLHMPDAGIHEMWNAGIEWVIGEANQRRNVNVLFLNDDLEMGDRFVQRMAEALRSEGNLVAVSGNYDGRTGPLVEQTQDICAGRYDGTGGFAGFAFAVRGEWFGSGYRFPTECKWWFGDNDLVQAAALSGVGTVGIAIDAHVVHIDGGSQTGGDWSHLTDQLRADQAAYEARWALIRSTGNIPPPPPVATQTVTVVSSIFGGYDEPCPLVLQHGVRDYLMVTDTPVDCAPWTAVPLDLAGRDPRYAGKEAKYQPWQFTDADIVAWLDGRVQTVSPGFVSWLVDQLGDADIALYRHPVRSSILDEATAALVENPAKYAGRDLVGQAKHYLTASYADNDLWQTTFYVARRNERTLAMGRRWQEEQDRFPDCLLDQIPLPPVIAECGVKVADLPGGFWDQHGRLYMLRPHIDGT